MCKKLLTLKKYIYIYLSTTTKKKKSGNKANKLLLEILYLWRLLLDALTALAALGVCVRVRRVGALELRCVCLAVKSTTESVATFHERTNQPTNI